ncbi:MAG: gamma-glutamyltransferase family protein [Firmicutes bacterium]|nr:gamma-glutamyltransferase family protein [Bacillota bacterium]
MNLSFDPLRQQYASQRFPIYARGGMVASSSPLSSAAGLEILKKGGNAMDAAIATATALTVVDPTVNGIGSDAFALIWNEKEQKLYGLNASGRSPMLISREAILEKGLDKEGKMPVYGWTPVTVPGAPSAWAAISERFGKLPLSEVMAPAVRYGRDGFPCSPNLSQSWKATFKRYKEILTDPCYQGWFDTFTPFDRGYEPGEIIYLKDHADTLEQIAKTNAAAFYTGDLARKIDEESRKFGGFLRYEDLSAHQPVWVEPLSVNYRGYDVCEIPPNGQGVIALIALNILKEFTFTSREDPDQVHRQIEAMKMAFAEGLKYITDPACMKEDMQKFLEPAYGKSRAEKISTEAQIYTDQEPAKSGTVYFCCADGEGNMVSYIQSNYMGFGSGIVVKGTGISLQNRGADFTLDPSDANCIAPGKKTYHTIIPGFLMKDGKAVGPFGVMGGTMQPQGHVQVVMNLIDFHMDPQQALDAPRWQWMKDGSITVETRFDPNMALALQRRGHRVRVDLFTPSFGRGQIILRLENGTLVGGTESRTDSHIACY